MKKLGETDQTLFISHHPPQWLMPDDYQRIRRYFNNSLILNGHLHDTGGGFMQDLSGSFHQFQAGGAYLGSESKWPARFHYITLDWKENKIRLDFRKYNKRTGQWSLDGETGKDGRASFDMSGAAPATKREDRQFTFAEIPESYCRWIVGHCGTMDAAKLYDKGEAFPLRLPEIFIPLYADEPGDGREKSAKVDEKEAIARQKPVDIEHLIGRHDYLLIEGQAGSGKTTLLKHIACALSGKEAELLPPEGLYGYLPVVVILKDVEAVCPSEEKLPGREALNRYFANNVDDLLDLAKLGSFLDAGRVVFLVAGLDEIRPDLRDAVIHVMADMVLRHEQNRIVLAGRPHGMEGTAIERYGSRRVRIHSLNPRPDQTVCSQMV